MRYTRTFDAQIMFSVTVDVRDNTNFATIGGITDNRWITPQEVTDILATTCDGKSMAVMVSGTNGTSLDSRLRYFRFIEVIIGNEGPNSTRIPWSDLKSFHVIAKQDGDK
jgi:hypothetical protein